MVGFTIIRRIVPKWLRQGQCYIASSDLLTSVASIANSRGKIIYLYIYIYQKKPKYFLKIWGEF